MDRFKIDQFIRWIERGRRYGWISIRTDWLRRIGRRGGRSFGLCFYSAAQCVYTGPLVDGWL